MKESVQMKDVNYSNTKWQGADLQSSSFEQFNLGNSTFNEGSLSNTSFSNVNMDGALIRYANIRNMQFINADMSGSLIKACNLSEMNVEGNAWWDMQIKQCDVFGLNFEGGTLEAATFTNSHLVNISINNCVIHELRINGVSVKELIENHPDYRIDNESIPEKVIYNGVRERI